MTLTSRRRVVPFALVLGIVAALAPVNSQGRPQPRAVATVDPAIRTAAATVAVVVQGGGAAAKKAVETVGGVITRDLPIVGGFAARLPGRAVHRVVEIPGVRAVSLDGRMHVQGSLGGVSTVPSVYRKVVRSDDLAATGAQGQGVTVALVDTGVSAMADLAGRIVPVPDPLGLTTSPCVDFSGSGTCADQYGHGTFVAGLIAGNGAASLGTYTAPAPQARILSVKIAGADGSADVSDVLAAIQWVVSMRDRFGVKVLNLSLGTDSTQSYRIDPLDYAVERAWQSGITVVVAASNRGPAAGTISKPADDPFVLTVGATDDRGTAGLGDDALPNFSSRGPTAADGLAKPDVVAPGAHLVSLAAPGATITTQFPSTMAAPYRRGSGTSFAAGVVSGVVAQMLSADATLTPDRVKYALMATARPDASSDPMAVGSGVVDAYSATFAAPAGLANQGVTPGSGGGSIALSRGSVQLSAAGLVTLDAGSGGLTAQLRLFDPLAYVSDPWTQTSWLYSQWLGNNWAGNNWAGNNWAGNNWAGNNWAGNNWAGNNWASTDWYGNNWAGSAWYGAWDQ